MIPIPGLLENSTADIYPGTTAQDADGGFNPTYPAFPSFQALPCSAQPRQVEERTDEHNRVSRVKQYHVFFNDNPFVEARDKIIMTDSMGESHTLIVEAARDEGGAGDYFVVRAIERL